MPLLALLRLGLMRSAEFHIDKLLVAVERENDVSLGVAADAEGFQRRFTDLSLFKVSDDLLGQRFERDGRRLILLFGLGGRTEKLRLLAEDPGQLFKAPANTTGTAFAHIHAIGEIQREGAFIGTLSAFADRAIIRNLFVAPEDIGRQVPVRKRDHGFPVVHEQLLSLKK